MNNYGTGIPNRRFTSSNRRQYTDAMVQRDSALVNKQHETYLAAAGFSCGRYQYEW
jgi:hypothetical protein